jgi:hypothetical protein
VLFFDLSSMQPEELRAPSSGARLRRSKLSPADLIAVASFSTSLQVDQTSPPIARCSVRPSTRKRRQRGRLRNGATGDPEDTPDNGNVYRRRHRVHLQHRSPARRVADVSDELSGIEQRSR